MLLMCIVVGFSCETTLKTARTFRQLYDQQMLIVNVCPAIFDHTISTTGAHHLSVTFSPLTARITIQILTCFINIYHYNAPLFRRTLYSCSKVLRRQKLMNKPRDSFIMIT